MKHCPCDNYVDGDYDPKCELHGKWASTNDSVPAPPAEPDSGVQEPWRKIAADLINGAEKHPENDTAIVELDDLLNLTIELYRPFRKSDTSSDHVEHVLQKARELVSLWERRASQIRVNCKDPNYRDGLIDATNDCRVDLEKLLSSPRSNSPATVSASPDSAPWTVIHYEHPQKIWQIWQGDKHITNSTDGDALTILADAHNATLPAPRSGSEVSGVSSLEELITELKNRLDSQFFILSAPGTDGRTLVDFTSRLYVTDYSPSAPSSTEQKGT